ncbi:MAG TPA: hypothetical protein ENN38_05390 [Actinobacteria bacterium]|nr:hypothetical protein [Actinomycetota bacterium]
MKLFFKIWRVIATAIWIVLSIAVIYNFSPGMLKLLSQGNVLQGLTWLLLFIAVPLFFCFVFYLILMLPVGHLYYRLNEARKVKEEGRN